MMTMAVAAVEVEDVGIVVRRLRKELPEDCRFVCTMTVFVSVNKLPILPITRGPFVFCDQFSTSIAPNISPAILSTCHYPSILGPICPINITKAIS